MAGIKSLTDVVNTLTDRFRAEADEQVKLAVDKVSDGDSGVDAFTITLKLKFERSGRKIEISPSLSSAEKRSPYIPVELFVNKDGVLVEEDPKQTDFGFGPGKVTPITGTKGQN